MTTPPSVNPDVHEIADRAKYAYTTITKQLADMAYRLAELAGTGKLDTEAVWELHDMLHEIWQQLYSGTVCAVRDETTDDSWAEADNTYSDGRTVMTQIQVEPAETAEHHWEYNQYLLGDGAVMDHPRETICYIAPHGRGYPR